MSEDKTNKTSIFPNLGGHSVNSSDTVSPVSTADRDDGNLGGNDGSANGVGNFLGALDSQSNVSVSVSHHHKRLEARSLTGTSLLLNGHDLGNLVLELGQKGLHNLMLLDGQREEVDGLQRLDETSLDQTTQLGDGHPAADVVVLLGSAALGTS
jgi:hypothetical protein